MLHRPAVRPLHRRDSPSPSRHSRRAIIHVHTALPEADSVWMGEVGCALRVWESEGSRPRTQTSAFSSRLASSESEATVLACASNEPSDPRLRAHVHSVLCRIRCAPARRLKVKYNVLIKRRTVCQYSRRGFVFEEKMTEDSQFGLIGEGGAEWTSGAKRGAGKKVMFL